MPHSIGIARVQGVWGYSDYSDVVVEMESVGAVVQRGDTLFLQLSLNGKKMRVSQSGDHDERVYHRCATKSG